MSLMRLKLKHPQTTTVRLREENTQISHIKVNLQGHIWKRSYGSCCGSTGSCEKSDKRLKVMPPESCLKLKTLVCGSGFCAPTLLYFICQSWSRPCIYLQTCYDHNTRECGKNELREKQNNCDLTIQGFTSLGHKNDLEETHIFIEAVSFLSFTQWGILRHSSSFLNLHIRVGAKSQLKNVRNLNPGTTARMLRISGSFAGEIFGGWFTFGL